jgi:hypothetical protein
MKMNQHKLSSNLWVFLAAVVAGSLLLFCIHWGWARHWNPHLSHDTLANFYPRLEAWDLRLMLIDPKTLAPESDQTKPLFLLLAKGWLKLFSASASNSGLAHNVFAHFIFTGILLAFWSLIGLGFVLGRRWLFLMGGLASFGSAWGIAVCYFTSYTGYSFALMTAAMALCFKQYPWFFWAGVLCCFNVFMSQSVLAPILALGLVLFLSHSLQKRKLVLPWRFGLGFLTTLGLFELIIKFYSYSIAKPSMLLVVSIFRYLQRSFYERSDSFAVYQQSLATYHLDLYVPMLKYGAALAGFYFLSKLLLVKRWRKYSANYLEWVAFVVLSFYVFESKAGPKFSRTYFLFLPFLLPFVFEGVLGIAALFSAKRMRSKFIKWALVGAVCGAFFTQIFMGLNSLRAAALDVVDRGHVLMSLGNPLWTLKEDTYSLFFLQLFETPERTAGQLREAASICEIVKESNPTQKAYFFAGPNLPSILNFGSVRTGELDTDWAKTTQMGASVAGDCDGQRWAARLIEYLPFFAHYPFLVLEDPKETTAMVLKQRYGVRDFEDGVARVRLWEVIPSEHKAD